MELLTKPYSKQQKKAAPIFPPHAFEKSRSLSPATCGGGVATQKQPQEGACAQGGGSVAGAGAGEEAYGGPEMLYKQSGSWKDPSKQPGPAEPREALGAEGGQRFWDLLFFFLF